jgi:uncharacterized protein (DUF2235 family)
MGGVQHEDAVTDRTEGRNLVICLDGTRNEPETGTTNVIRTFEITATDDTQVVYYDPGVGTLGARSATTRLGKAATRVLGLVLGHGVKENVEEAYRFLMHTYRKDDRIFVFGFSRGAYTALALTGMLRTVGLLRPEAVNLVPYAMKLYTKSGKKAEAKGEEKEYWDLRDWFDARFGDPDFPHRFGRQVHFLGIWDAVKSVGWLNWRAKLQQARWPFTRKAPNVRHGRHALALDERRRPYAAYRFDPGYLAETKRDLREMWFAGVHSDVGGTFRDDHRLSDIAFHWMMGEAINAGLRIDAAMYQDKLGIAPDQDLPTTHVEGKIHSNGFGWAVVGLGWRPRVIGEGDEIHDSVYARHAATKGSGKPYRPDLP